MRSFPKPSEIEDKITLTPKQRAAKLQELCARQNWRCANCKREMRMQWGWLDSAELDHRKPEPMGCKKRDNDDNLQALCATCNGIKGSKRY